MNNLNDLFDGSDVRTIAKNALKLGYKCNYDPPGTTNRIIFYGPVQGVVYNYVTGELLCVPVPAPKFITEPGNPEESYKLRDGCLVNYYYDDAWIASHRTAQDLSKYTLKGYNVGATYLSLVDVNKFDKAYTYTFHITCDKFHVGEPRVNFVARSDKSGIDAGFVHEFAVDTPQVPDLKWGYITRGDNPVMYVGPYMHALKVFEKNAITSQRAAELDLPYDAYCALYAVANGGYIYDYYCEYSDSALREYLDNEFNLVLNELVSSNPKNKTSKWFAGRMKHTMNEMEIRQLLRVCLAGWVPVVKQFINNTNKS